MLFRSRLDGVLMTHSHADHTHGMDDLRPLVIAMRKRVDIHMDEATSRAVRQAFDYLFESPPGSFYPPLLNEKRLVSGEAVWVDGQGGAIEALPFLLEHGEIPALGLRFGRLAYTPDLNGIPRGSLQFLEGLDIWIIDGLRYKPHPTHLSVDEALAWIERMRPVTGAGISTAAFSVMTSHITWSSCTRSPGFTCQATTSAETVPSPRSGILNT